ncbi:MAG: hypothetical protein IPM30_04315 [Burkholderiales bacterium]|nr:hypothetical protein [Burkholderiales bacterium]
MKGFLIDPVARTVTPVEIEGGIDGVRELIGFPTVDSDEIDETGDRLFFDEACFIRSTPGSPRFRVDNLAPVAGRGVVVGSSAQGKELAGVAIGLEALRRRVTFS